MDPFEMALPLFTRRSRHICLHGGPVPPYIRKGILTRPRGEGDPR